MAPSAHRHAHLKPQEEEWRDIYDRLSERFPTISGQRIAQALREHKGHAGEAARFLRDLSSSDVKEADPEDIEHVATLLSSPAMFKHACKEQFRKFDVNRDGVLEWEEVKQLVNAIYEEFGLQLPSEGSVRAFFCATDVNQDGVLSEREFRKFFEMFLRYAFFEPLKLRQVVERGKAVDAGKGEGSAPISGADSGNNSRASTSCGASSHDEPAKVSLVPVDLRQHSERKTPKGTSSGAHRHKRSTPKDGQLPLSPALRTPKAGQMVGWHSPSAGQDKHQRKGAHREREHEHEAARSLGQSASAPSLSAAKVRCLAPQGVAFRATPTYQDRTQNAVGKGECVRILEHWVRTSDGWLPLMDPEGHSLFDKAREDTHTHSVESRKKASNLQANDSEMGMRSVSTSPCRREADNQVGIEEEWRPLFNNLSDRFPNIGKDKIKKALRDNDGHAGKAAQDLRCM